MDRLALLKTFCVVVREGSFTRTAERLDTSNQLVSKYVAQLEKELDVRLFNRTTRKIHLTEAGQQCFEHAKHILESVEDMEGQLGLLNTSAKGVLRVSAPVSFSTLHLSTCLGAFQQKHPHVSVNLQLNDRKVDVIDEGFDVAIRAGQLNSSSFIAKRIATIKLVLCASPEYLEKNGVPTHPNDLNPEHYLEYSYINYDDETSELIQILKTNSQRYKPRLTVNNGEVLTDVAKMGLGYVLQPTFIAGRALKNKELISILNDHTPPSIGLYAVYPHRKLISNKLRVFIDFLSEYFADTHSWE